MSLNTCEKEMLEMLKARFPGKVIMTLDDYAEFQDISRRGAAGDVRRRKIKYTKNGRSMFIRLEDFAKFLAAKTMIDGQPVYRTPEEIGKDIKRRRGFCQPANRL